jgi:hypothetical protein
MVPVNSVTSGDMHSVTSGAVYSELVSGNAWIYIKPSLGTAFMYKTIGKFVYLHIASTNSTLKFIENVSYMRYADGSEVVLPNSIRPSRDTNVVLIDNTFDTMFHGRIYTNGKINVWNNSIKIPTDVVSWTADIVYRID